MELVEEIFPQGDSRYNDFQTEELVCSFIEKKGIQIEKRIIIDTKITKKEMENIKGPQEYPKAIATEILKKEGYDLIGYERKFRGGIVDVLAKDRFGNTIAIECYACRTMKAVEYLEEDNTVLWIIPATDEKEFLSNTLSLYIIKRGINWELCIKEYKKEKLKRMKGVMEIFEKNR